MLFRLSILNLYMLSPHKHKGEKVSLKWRKVLISPIYNQSRISFSKATPPSETMPATRDQTPKYLSPIGDISHSSQPLCNWKIWLNPVSFNGKHSQCLQTEGIKKRMKMLRVIRKIMAGAATWKDSRQHTCWRVAVSTHAYPFPETQPCCWLPRTNTSSWPVSFLWDSPDICQGGTRDSLATILEVLARVKRQEKEIERDTNRTGKSQDIPVWRRCDSTRKRP